MGLFSRKTKIYVASSVYNLAGDINLRPDYLKTAVISSALGDSLNMSEVITNSYLTGPGIKLRQYGNWSKTNYDPIVGIAGNTLGVIAKVDSSIVLPHLPSESGSTTYIQSANIDFADFEEWCDKYLYDNYPNRIDEEFEIDIDTDTNLITMTSLEGGSTITFVPDNFEPGRLYLYVDYTYYKSPTVQPPDVNPPVRYSDEDDLPSTFLWSETSDVTTSRTTELNTTVVTTSTYSDGRPDETSTTTNTTPYSWTSYVKAYSRGFTIQPNDTTVILDNRVMVHIKDSDVVSNSSTVTTEETLEDGTVKTTAVVTTTESLSYYYTSQITNNNTIMESMGYPNMFIYKQGDGIADLDALFDTQDEDSRFYSFIPIRQDGSWLEDWDIYPHTVKAFKKATTGKLGKVIDDLKDNNDINDIQYIYAAFACSLNSPDNKAKEYIYRFFQMASEAFPVDSDYPTLESVIAGYAEQNQVADTYYSWWKDNNKNTNNPPPAPNYPLIPSRSFRVYSENGYSYDMTLSWNYSFETIHSGVAWEGARTSQLRTRYAGNIVLTRKNLRRNSESNLEVYTQSYDMEEYEILWQDSPNTYRKMRVLGLGHNNRVYGNKSVYTSVSEAMNDAEESGFLIPLNTAIYRSMSLISSTQLATACTYLVLNSYKKVKQKWYQTGLFKVVIIVVAIVISVYTAGAGGAGILGTYASVGASLGFVGVAALIVGAIANAIAAMVLVSIIQRASVSLLGDKLGIIVGAIAGFIALNVGTSLTTGMTMSTMFGEMMNAPNLTMLTSTVGNGISQYINVTTQETIAKTERLMQQYNTDSKEIQEKYNEMFGIGTGGVIDPYQFISIESLDVFLNRTLLTGSDISDMSMNMITNFTDLTLDTSLK